MVVVVVVLLLLLLLRLKSLLTFTFLLVQGVCKDIEYTKSGDEFYMYI